MEGETLVSERQVDRRPVESGPRRQPLQKIDLAGSLFGSTESRARSAFASGVRPSRGAGRYRRWIRLEEMLVVQLAKFGTLPLFGETWTGRSVARASAAAPSISLLLARRVVSCSQRRPLGTERVQMPDVPIEVLSGPSRGLS